MTTAIARHSDLRNRQASMFSGLVFALALTITLVDFIWLGFVGGGAFFVQAPLLLLGLTLTILSGLVYLSKPHDWVGPALWGFTYFCLDLTVRQGGDGGGAQSVMKGLLSMVLMVFFIFQGSTKVFRHTMLTLFFGYCALSLLSTAYSTTKLLAFGAGLGLMGIAFGTAAASAMTSRQLESYWKSLYVATYVAAVASLVLLAVAPMWARDLGNGGGSFRLKGINGAANSLGPMMAVGALAARLMIKQAPTRFWRWFHWGGLIVMTVALLLTNSRTSIIGMAFGVIVTGLLSGTIGVRGFLALCSLAVISMGILLQPDAVYGMLSKIAGLFSRSGHVEEITSFTGRKDIWHAAWNLWLEKPLFGYGLGSVRTELPRVHADEWGNTYTSTHNFILESLVAVGAVGTLMLLLSMLLAGWALLRFLWMSARMTLDATDVRNREVAVCAMRCFVMLLCHAAMEKAFAGTPAPSTLALGLCIGTGAYMAIHYRGRNHAPLSLGEAPPPLKAQAFAK